VDGPVANLWLLRDADRYGRGRPRSAPRCAWPDPLSTAHSPTPSRTPNPPWPGESVGVVTGTTEIASSRHRRCTRRATPRCPGPPGRAGVRAPDLARGHAVDQPWAARPSHRLAERAAVGHAVAGHGLGRAVQVSGSPRAACLRVVWGSRKRLVDQLCASVT
jgi:hypothetical protein